MKKQRVAVCPNDSQHHINVFNAKSELVRDKNKFWCEDCQQEVVVKWQERELTIG
jgi:Zn finger protein HypA/HybF involved in hydrogenase expression